MSIEIKNPKEDQYGNSKENIFLAFSDDGSYLGSAYTYPNINYHQVNETPYLIFIDIDIESNMDKLLKDEVKQKLFDKVFLRAKELHKERPDLKARIYSGFEYNNEKLDFYIKNGFDENYSIIMEADIEENPKYTFTKVEVTEINLSSQKELMEYSAIYNEIFISPLDVDALLEQSKAKHFKNLYFLVDGIIQGGCTIFEKDGYGYIETLYVLSEARGKGISKIIVKYIFNYFLSKNLNKTKLEVWELNKRAINLYKSFGYNEVEKNFMFPGITL
ncbi:GNAT family N-acetyltransferase [Clostridium sp. UBA7503]|uniref:GNAT family N-acetyltransferase n=1 Tax=Clostridium sp. UBA7503 TaxID=1946377 RepID=UPI00321721DB